jgi:hypothetical protein
MSATQENIKIDFSDSMRFEEKLNRLMGWFYLNFCPEGLTTKIIKHKHVPIDVSL